MIVICEDCGKKYNIDVDKIKSDVAKFRCTACNHINTVRKPPAEELKAPEIEFPPPDKQMPPPQPPQPPQPADSKATPAILPKRGGLLGIRGRMMILLVIVPIILLTAVGIFYLNQSTILANLITDQSNEIVTDMAASIIGDKGRSVANEVKIYLDAHPGLKREDFSKDPEFKKIAVQKVGKTGYTVIINAPTDTEPCRIWAHPNNKLIGVDVFKAMKKKFGEKGSKGFIDIHKKVFKTGKESGGYYRFLDNRDKYMVIVPIEGTDLFLPSTTYIDEFTQPMVALKNRADNVTGYILRTVIIIQLGIIFIVALIAFLYGNSLSGKIRYLTEVAEHVSIGELEEEITVKSKDEIGALADAIGRMQDSIRISLDRLRRRRR
jgi:nitrogen fixation/metabolism regulation signal transduction histidine kinase